MQQSGIPVTLALVGLLQQNKCHRSCPHETDHFALYSLHALYTVPGLISQGGVGHRLGGRPRSPIAQIVHADLWAKKAADRGEGEIFKESGVEVKHIKD